MPNLANPLRQTHFQGTGQQALNPRKQLKELAGLSCTILANSNPLRQTHFQGTGKLAPNPRILLNDLGPTRLHIISHLHRVLQHTLPRAAST